jgi:predicted permease
MQVLAYLRGVGAKVFRRDELAEEMQEELRSHIAHRADDLERTGMGGAEAERRARIEFGARERFREESFQAVGGNLLVGLGRDLRFALRVLRKDPGFTVTAVLTLALAIGANAVVFAVLNALILKPLNVPHAESLYVLERASDKWGYESYPNYLDLRDRNTSFDGLAANNMAQAGLNTGQNPSNVWLFEASGNYFDVMGIQPYLGRFFHDADERGVNSAPYIVLMYAYWHSHFQDDRGVLGRVVQLNKHPFTIIGVAPPEFQGSFPVFAADMFVPLVNQEQVDGQAWLNVRANKFVSEIIGHLKPGVTPAQAAADLSAIGAQVERSYPRDATDMKYILAHPGVADVFGGAVRAFLTGLMVLVGLILLAACANLGSLFAARAADRSREVALRLALGSSRMRILRQLMTEAVLIAVAGGALGLGGSVAMLRRLSAWQPFPQFPLSMPVSPDAKLYLMALLLALASGLLFGIMPMRQVLRANPYQIVKAGSWGARGRRVTARDVLLVVQIAICAVLVTASMVAVRGLTRSLRISLGIEPRDAMLVEANLSMAGYRGDQTAPMQRRMIDAMGTIPGVKMVGLVDTPPLHMGWMTTVVFSDQTTEFKEANAAAKPMLYRASPEYFQAAGTRVLAGRTFSWHDDAKAPRVAVINLEFARKVFGSAGNAMGRYFKRRDGTRAQVVGIVEDGKYTANIAEEPQAALFLPILQSPVGDAWLVVRSSREPQQLAAAIRGKLRELDAGLPSFIQTWGEEMNGAMFASRMATITLGVLGVIGAMLSITGIFGMAAYAVSKRLRELGIRVALGARRTELLRTALRRPFQLLLLGSSAGLALGLLGTRALAYIVYAATPRDPLVLSGVVLVMAVLGLVATWIPAQRALGIDPMVLLREE